MSAIHTGPVPIPADVVDYVTQIFEDANNAASGRLDRMPTTHEETLDLTFLDSLAAASGPHVTKSGVVIDFDVHFVGGGRHWQSRWEIADLGLIINFRRSGILVRTKIILLQSKRLYPVEAEFVEFRGLQRLGGMGSLMGAPWLPAQESRTFTFTTDCRYKAMQIGDEQWTAIRAYEKRYDIPVHYLLYHPSEMPFSREIPTQVPLEPRTTPAEVGARVISARQLRTATALSPRAHAPSFGEISQGSAAPGFPVHEFIRDEVLTCRQGYVADPNTTDEGLNVIFSQRGAPIAAAVRLNLDVPEDLVLPDSDADGLPF